MEHQINKTRTVTAPSPVRIYREDAALGRPRACPTMGRAGPDRTSLPRVRGDAPAAGRCLKALSADVFVFMFLKFI